ncbi:hypothetical protein BDQ17DRAFT_1431692 [Cyathus striatus]|nr:hypothetical protein BDQ17DRAFT_1431692 [Cyathus striatus]
MSSKVILVTGSNSGIGFEIVRILAMKGHTVYLLLEERRPIVARFQKRKILKAKDINNAGVTGLEYSQDPYEMSHELLDYVFKTNFTGAVNTTTAFLPLLKKSSEPVITNVSSELGSNSAQSASKAALNSYTIQLAHLLKGDQFKVNAVVPGHTATRMTHYRGARTVTEGAESIIRWALLDKDGPTGRLGYFEEGEYPW